MRRRFPLPPHRTVLDHLAECALGALGTAPGGAGIELGHDLLGGTFAFDPFSAYRAGVVTNPNVAVLGAIGRGKSTFVKQLLLGELQRGRRAVVVDPKGEYGELARHLGTDPVVLRPGGTAMLNPIGGDGPDAVRRDVALVTALAEHGLERSLEPTERVALDLARTACGQAATVEHVVRALLDPAPGAGMVVRLDDASLSVAGRAVAYELRRYTAGDRAGMLDGGPENQLDLGAPLLVLDCSALWGTDALGPVMAAVIAAARRAEQIEPRYLVLDEAWAVLADPTIARWLRGAWKLARANATSHILVLHRVSDVEVGGGDASLAASLLADSATVISFGLGPRDAEDLGRVLGVSRPARALVPQLERGTALVKVGQRYHLVHLDLDATGRGITATDGAMWASS